MITVSISEDYLKNHPEGVDFSLRIGSIQMEPVNVSEKINIAEIAPKPIKISSSNSPLYAYPIPKFKLFWWTVEDKLCIKSRNYRIQRIHIDDFKKLTLMNRQELKNHFNSGGINRNRDATLNTFIKVINQGLVTIEQIESDKYTGSKEPLDPEFIVNNDCRLKNFAPTKYPLWVKNRGDFRYRIENGTLFMRRNNYTSQIAWSEVVELSKMSITDAEEEVDKKGLYRPKRNMIIAFVDELRKGNIPMPETIEPVNQIIENKVPTVNPGIINHPVLSKITTLDLDKISDGITKGRYNRLKGWPGLMFDVQGNKIIIKNTKSVIPIEEGEVKKLLKMSDEERKLSIENKFKDADRIHLMNKFIGVCKKYLME